MVLSDKVLDVKSFHSNDSTNKWKECSLRQWLNGTDDGDFLKEAFSLSEQAAINTISVESYPTGYDGVVNDEYLTEDMVFLLEDSDMTNFIYWFNESSEGLNQAQTAKITTFANTNGKLPVDGILNWWLRTPYNNYSDAAMCVYGAGVGSCVVRVVAGVRPALRINLQSSYVTEGEDIRVSVKGSEWDVVSFGTYGGKKINWRVLNVTGNDALLLSDEVIAYKEYHDKYESITWENCNLRRWLNNEFINEAFSESEKAIICNTSVTNPDNIFYETTGGNDTTDKIFLLSMNDIIQTAYGFPSLYNIHTSTRIIKNPDDQYDSWWICSPGSGGSGGSAMCVNSKYGTVHCQGDMTGMKYGVRPALYINLSSLSWTKGEPVQVGDPTDGVEIPLNPDDRTDFPIENSDNPSDNPVNPSQGGSSGSSSGQQNNNGNTGKTDISSNPSSNPSSHTQGSNGAVKKAQSIKGVKNLTKSYSTKKFSIKAKTSGNGKITYSSSNKKVATV
ncbi:MAG: DUF6273 domain-containing protein [Eubacterium sp.]|nr:DUF6273 domain-containing protein [Eubacterium sp.]